MPGIASSRTAMRVPTAPLFIVAALLALAAPFPARAVMENCAQVQHDSGLPGSDFVRIDPAEDCFGSRRSVFVGYSLLISNPTESFCEAELIGGVFTSRNRWIWNAPAVYRFGPLQTQEVYFDFSGIADFPVSDIRMLYGARGISSACGGNLEVRYASENPFPMKGTYYNTKEKDAYFRIHSEDYVRHDPTSGAYAGPVATTIVRLPADGLRPVIARIPYELYTDVRRSEYMLDRGEEDDETDDERFLSQYHLERWDDRVRVWETIMVSRPKDVSELAIVCVDGAPDCYGDRGFLQRALTDGHYRLRARHSWGVYGWRGWSEWRRFHVNHSVNWLPDPEAPWTWRSDILYWVYNVLLGPDPLFRRPWR